MDNNQNNEPQDDMNVGAASHVPPTGSSSEPAAQPAGEDPDKFLKAIKKGTSATEKALVSAYQKTRDAFQTGKIKPRATIEFIERLLRWSREFLSQDKFEAIGDWFTRYGHAGLLAAQVLTVLFYTIAAIQCDSGALTLLLQGVGMAVLLVVLQYTAEKFLGAGKGLIKSSPSRLGSAAFLDCLALLAEVAGILLFLYFFVQAAQGSWSMVIVGLGAWALCGSIAYVALHPSMANVTISDDVRAGEEAIGIMSFFVKALVTITPMAFGIGTVVFSFALLAGTFSLLGKKSLDTGLWALGLIVFCVCLPFLTYVLLAFHHLIVDVLRSILVIPQKLDRLAGKDE